jgi:hypothetical protein
LNSAIHSCSVNCTEGNTVEAIFSITFIFDYT